MIQTVFKNDGNWRMALQVMALTFLFMCVGGTAAWAEEDESPFDVAEIYFELNNTDGDLGIHSLIDGDPWKRLEIEDPRERRMLNIFVQGRLRKQGLTELFFESAEPTFDELSPERFFRRFREGWYEVEGTTLDGEELESVTYLSHVMPAPPSGVHANNTYLPEGCDDENPPVVELGGDLSLVVTWDPVVSHHPDLGAAGDIDVIRYQVVLEFEREDLDFEGKISMDLPPDVTRVEIPPAILNQADEFKLEILVREESGNQTAVESCFALE